MHVLSSDDLVTCAATVASPAVSSYTLDALVLTYQGSFARPGSPLW
jgi:hypothetical protein